MIQTTYRKYIERKHTLMKIQEKWNYSQASFDIQQQHFFHDWDYIMSEQRIEIHVPCMDIPASGRASIYAYKEQINMQIPRIFATKDRNVKVVYITPIKLSDEVRKYW